MLKDAYKYQFETRKQSTPLLVASLMDVSRVLPLCGQGLKKLINQSTQN